MPDGSDNFCVRGIQACQPASGISPDVEQLILFKLLLLASALSSASDDDLRRPRLEAIAQAEYREYLRGIVRGSESKSMARELWGH